MIEIRSDWKTARDEQGEVIDMLVIFMSIDNKPPVNCALNMSELEPERVQDMLIMGMEQLTNACYPELNDTLYHMKKELKELEARVEFMKRNVRDMERARTSND